jgi:hypothetical protein
MFIDESLTAKGFTPAWAVPQVYGRPRTIESITIHWWGAYGQTHDGVLNFFVNGPGTTSAHFVCSAGRTHCLVSPVDAAWHAGNPVGNATSIGIECRPEGTDADYAEVAALVAWLRNTYGQNLPLIPHRHWQATQCPGTWDLARIDRLARDPAPAPAPAPSPAPPPPEEEDNMLIIAKAPDDPRVWIGDGVTRRHIPNPGVLQAYQWLAKNGLLKIVGNGDVQTIPAGMECIGLDVAGSLADRIREINPVELAGLIPDDLAEAVADQLAKRLAS